MFLTTVRVRRARPTTLDHVLTGAAFTAARESKTVVEVTCHGQPVAVIDVAAANGRELLWQHPQLVDTTGPTSLVSTARAATKVMAATQKAGLTTREPATV